jgi:hypothetical protein
MSRRIWIALHIPLVFGLLAANPASATEVSDFRSGLVCDPGKHGWICLRTEDIHLTGQSRCVYAKQEMPCTWYGFSFQYSDNKPGTLLECKYRRVLPSALGNPKEVLMEDDTEGSYSLPLEGTEGTLYNPQYTIFGVHEPGQAMDTITTRCSVEGREVANFRFNIITAEIPE